MNEDVFSTEKEDPVTHQADGYIPGDLPPQVEPQFPPNLPIQTYASVA